MTKIIKVPSTTSTPQPVKAAATVNATDVSKQFVAGLVGALNSLLGTAVADANGFIQDLLPLFTQYGAAAAAGSAEDKANLEDLVDQSYQRAGVFGIDAEKLSEQQFSAFIKTAVSVAIQLIAVKIPLIGVAK